MKRNRTYIDFKCSILSLQKISMNAAGDFIRDAQRDVHLPNARNWRELEDYLRENHSSEIIDNVCDAARIVWKRYRSKYPAYLA